MNKAAESVKNTVEMALLERSRPTDDELRNLVKGIAKAIAPNLDDVEIEEIAREIEYNLGIKAGLVSIVDSDDFEPWLEDAKSTIVPFYWTRYKKLLVQKGLPQDVIISTDTVTDKILSRLGNPNKQVTWDRRGMVVGHVQSGKTSNYTGLICKAADAGYRLIIVIAGIHNNLRNQTQERIDEGFIGIDTGKSLKTNSSKHIIGVGKFDPNNRPVGLTNTLKDFNKTTASTNTSEIDSYKVPVVLVIKKNSRTLSNLISWLSDNSAAGDQEMIDQPMLLIDDEADNASINTKYGKKTVTKINGQIRDLLNLFRRSCYIGYTATPFANIFIDPDQDDEMYSEDLFPRDFIVGLDAPNNYFGPKKIFIDGLSEKDNPTWVRTIDDNEDILPIKHPIDIEFETLPRSLLKSLRVFLIARTIRNLRGQKSAHCSMLVNASRFTSVQTRIRNRLHDALELIVNAIRVNASRGHSGLSDPELDALHQAWREEYAPLNLEFDWMEIQENLLESVAAAKVVEVNSNKNDLDYSNLGDRGQTVIAVGGFSLSRGLTLEGLTVTWFLRNTLMYDTLMQMGRWFGYREKYEDICRIWMPLGAANWYSFIASATEELHGELQAMDRAKATPNMFGLSVRSHPVSLLVTARNKLGSGKKITTLVGLSNKFIETSKISIKPDILDANFKLAKAFVSNLTSSGCEEQDTRWGKLITDAPVEFIDEFLRGWRNATQSITTETGPVRSYINQRKSDELQNWDVLFSSNIKGVPDLTLGTPIVVPSRFVDLADLKDEFLSFSGKRMRVASRGIEKAGVGSDKSDAAERQYRTENGFNDHEVVNFPDMIYRKVRDKPLFILHYINVTPPRGREDDKLVQLIPKEPVVAWGLSLPVSSRPQERVEYVVNTVRYRELFGDEDEDDEEELIYGEI